LKKKNYNIIAECDNGGMTKPGKAGPGPGPIPLPLGQSRKNSVSLLKEEDSGDIGEDGKVMKRKMKYEYAGLDPQRILRHTEFTHLMMHCAPLGSSGRNLVIKNPAR
jgi:hypothetical protein